jgi:hypothetical protein
MGKLTRILMYGLLALLTLAFFYSGLGMGQTYHPAGLVLFGIAAAIAVADLLWILFVKWE